MLSRSSLVPIALLALSLPAAGALDAGGAMPGDDEFLPLRASVGAPEPASGIGPGSRLFISFPEEPGALYVCTANYVWSDASGALYLGAAGHCFLPADKRATHGPGADYDASGVLVRVCVDACSFGGQTGFAIDGETVALGRVAYARQLTGAVQVGHDFGLVEIPADLAGAVRYTEPVWGGPTGGVREVRVGTAVCLYGNAVGLGEAYPTMARPGVGVSSNAQGRWNAIIPSYQGDSGSALLTCENDGGALRGRYASGILTHIAPPYIAGTTMARAVAMAQQAGLAVEPRFG